MGIISNVLQTVFTTKGADKVVAQTDHVGRSQTRLGQTSAATGRQFAAQSAGLGGLVAAYAGAAATIFALQAAFDALARAAQSENIIKGTSALAAETAQSGPKILKNMKDITDGQITMAEAAQNANIAISAGFSTRQIEGLTKVALSASKALGRNLTDSLQRVVRGTAKLEPELLDELGIFVKLDPATRKYAAQLGVAASSLSEFERRQAFANAAIEEGSRKFGSIDTTVPSAQKSLEQLQASLAELSTEFLLIVAQSIQPFVDFMKNDAGNSLALFGVVLALVFSKGASIVGDFAGNGILKITSWADTISVKMQEAKGSFKEVELAAKKLGDEIDSSSRKGLQGADKSGRFNQKGVQKNVANEAAAARTRFLEGERLSIAQQAKDTAILTKAQEQLAARGRQTGLAYKDAGKIITAYAASTAKAGLATRALTGFTIGLSKSLTVLKAAGSAALSLFNGLFIISALADFAGFDIFGKLAGYFRDARKDSKELESGIVGLYAAASGGSKSLTDSLKVLGASSADIEKLNETVLTSIISTSDKAETRLTRLQNSLDSAKSISNVDNLRISLEQLGVQLASAKTPEQAAAIGKKIDEVTQRVKEADAVTIPLELEIAKGIQSSAVTIVQQELAILNKAIAESGGVASTQQALDRANLEGQLSYFKQYSANLGSIIGSLSAATGLGGEAVSKLITDSDIIRFNAASDSIEVFGKVIKLTGDGASDLNRLTEAQRDLLGSALLVENTLNETNAAYLAGAADANVLSGAIAGIRETLLSSEQGIADYTEELIAQGVGVTTATEKAQLFFAAQRKGLTDLTALRDALLSIEEATKNVGKVFGSDISALENLSFRGLVDSSGVFAKNQKEIAKNQTDILLTTLNTAAADFERSKVLAEITNRSKDENDELSKINANSKLYETTLKAIAGRLISMRQELDKIVSAQEKRAKLLVTETALLNQQLSINKSQANAELAQAERQYAIDSLDDQISRAKDLIELDKLRLKNTIERANFIDDLQRNEDAKLPDGLSNKRVKGVEDAAAKVSIKLDAEEAAGIMLDELNKGNDARKAIVDFELAGLTAVQQADQRLFDLETKSIRLQLEKESANIDTQIDILKSTAELDIARIEARAQAIQAEADIVLAQIEGYKQFAAVIDVDILNTNNKAKTVDAFGIHVANLSKVLSQYVSSNPEATGGVDVVAAKAVNLASIDSATALANDIGSSLRAAADLVNSNTEQVKINLEAEKTSIQNIADIKEATFKTEKATLTRRLSQLEETRRIQKGILYENQLAEQDKVQRKLDNLNSGLDAGGGSGKKKKEDEVESTVKDMLTAIFSGIDNAINTAIMDFSNLILYGEGSFSDIFANLFKSIQQTLFQETIANPLSNFLTENILGITKKGIDDAVVNPDGSLNVVVSNLAQFAIPQANEEGLADIIGDGSKGGFFTKLFAPLKDSLMGIFGKDGFIGKLFSGIGSLFSGGGAGGGGFLGGLFKGIFSLFGMAQGGMVHMAQGGGVSGLRDSVPTMLEPGEFVIRKPMARQIGAPALQAMNATGSMPQGDVQVNINNQGTPQDATASAPKFDGEKYVIDIITRDLSNNGPVRRALRGGR